MMKLIVNAHQILIDKSSLINEKEINVNKVEFEFDEEIPDDYTKEAYFTIDGKAYKKIISDNECEIPSEVLEKKGTFTIGVVAYKTIMGEYQKRFNPTPITVQSLKGSLTDAINSEEPTPSEVEQLENLVNQGLSEINELATDLQEKVDSGYFKGEKGDKGDKGDTGPAGQNGQDGQDGANGLDGVIQYTAGDNITIENNVISASGGSSAIFIPYNSTDQEKITKLQDALEMYQSGEQPLIILTNVIDAGNTPVVMTVASYDENNSNGSISFTGLGTSPYQTNSYNSIGYNAVRNYVFLCDFSNNQIYYLTSSDDICGYLINDISQNYTGYDASKTQVLKNVNNSIQWVDDNTPKVLFYEMQNNEINLTGSELMSMIQEDPLVNIIVHKYDGVSKHYYCTLSTIEDQMSFSDPGIDIQLVGDQYIEMFSSNSGTDKFKDVNYL